MKQYVISIAVYDRNDDDLTPVVLKGLTSEKEALQELNAFFAQEAVEGIEIHPEFESLDSVQGTRLEDEDCTRIYALSVDTIEAETSYEAYTRSMLHEYGQGGKTREQAFAEVFTNELNHQPFSGKEFARHLCHQHPTLQQTFFRLVKDCITTRAEERAYSNDERNEASVRMCRDLAPSVEKYHFPFK